MLVMSRSAPSVTVRVVVVGREERRIWRRSSVGRREKEGKEVGDDVVGVVKEDIMSSSVMM